VLVYTSGTTGKPKGVMISQDNITFLVRAGQMNNKFKVGEYDLVSYLPLSHMAALLIDIYGLMQMAGTTYFCDKDALKGTLVENLKEARYATTC
jgi:long-chain-fatty-acid--CoA ligase ACSBG